MSGDHARRLVFTSLLFYLLVFVFYFIAVGSSVKRKIQDDLRGGIPPRVAGYYRLLGAQQDSRAQQIKAEKEKQNKRVKNV